MDVWTDSQSQPMPLIRQDGNVAARGKTYYERKRQIDRVWIEVIAWTPIGLGAFIAFVCFS